MPGQVEFTSTFRGIPFAEKVPGSPDSAFSDDGGRSTRIIQVAWEDQYRAVEAWLGYAEVKLAAGYRYLSRTIPHCQPDYQWLWAQSIPRVEAVGSRGKRTATVPPQSGQTGSANEIAQYELAHLHVNYTAPEFEILPDSAVARDISFNDGEETFLVTVPDDALLKRYVSRIAKPSGRILTIHRGLMSWAPDRIVKVPGTGITYPNTQPIPEGIGKKVSTLTLTYIWHGVPREAVPFKAIQVQIGTVNDKPFDVEYWGFPAETLLFEAVDFRAIKIPRNDVVTHRGFDVQYTFRYEPKLDTSTTPPTVKGWNHEYRFVDGNLIPRRVNSSWSFVPNPITGIGIATERGNRPYEMSAFENLFRPDQTP